MIKIRKATQNQTITAIKSGDFFIVEKANDTARQETRNVFDAVASGSVPLIWYDMPPVRCQSGSVSFLRYALHRSTKKPGFLQLSCMEIKNGQIIPTSDRQYSINDSDGFRDFFRDLPREADINFLE